MNNLGVPNMAALRIEAAAMAMYERDNWFEAWPVSPQRARYLGNAAAALRAAHEASSDECRDEAARHLDNPEDCTHNDNARRRLSLVAA